MACAQEPAECQWTGGVGRVENLLEQKAKFYVRQARMLTNETLQNLRVVIKGVSRIPGRKTIVFLTEGSFVEESRGVLQQLAGQAARAGAAIYSIDGRGNINRMGAEQDVLQRERGRSTAFDTGDDRPSPPSGCPDRGSLSRASTTCRVRSAASFATRAPITSSAISLRTP
jgi:hypothetical protein